MADPERHDPLAGFVEEFLQRQARGERVDAAEFARTRAGGDEALRARLEIELGKSARDVGATRTLGVGGGTIVLEEPAAPASSKGRRIDGRYVVERELGEGGFGVVYLVRDEVHGNNLRALKTLRGELTRDADLVQRFRNEIITVKAISHRYVPRFQNDGRTPEGDLYYVMDFVDGVRLDDVLKKEGALKPDRIVQIVRQILEVLDFAHQKGVFHRDLKPANIILVKAGTPEEEVRVLDFGIAKITSREGEFSEMESMHTMQGGAIGTPHYMAPEQVTGTGKVDGKTDLYALGVIIYQMCSGRVPFTGKTSMEVAVARLTQAPPPLEEDTPEWLRALVMRLLERQKEKRPDTLELRTELEHLSHGQRDMRRMLTWIGAGILVIALGVAWLLWDRAPGGTPESARGPAPRPEKGDPVQVGAQPPKVTPSVTFAPVAFQSPAQQFRGTDPDIEVAVEARGHAAVKIGDRDVAVDADGIARARVRVATDEAARILVRDLDGKELGSRTVFVDTRPPRLSVDLPDGVVESGGRWLTSRRELVIRGRINDGDGGELATKPITIEGARGLESTEDGRFSATIDLTEGVRDLSVRGVDRVGHPAAFTRSLAVDFTDPVVEFSTPAGTTSADRVRLEGSVKDATTCTAKLSRAGEPDAQLALDEQGRFGREIALHPGRNELTVEALDAVGHVGQRTFAIERTRTAAAIASVEPKSGRQVAANSESIRVVITSNVGLSRVEVVRGAQRIQAPLAATNDGYTIDLPLAFGANVFEVTPYDAEGQPGATSELTYVRASSGVPPGCTLPPDVQFDAAGRPLRVVHERSGLELVLVAGGMRNGARVEDCYLGRTELTVGELERLRGGYYAAAESRPAFWGDIAAQRARHPAVKISFAEARSLCRDLGLRLPTTDEWELAAGGGDGRAYPWGADWTAKACNSDEDGDSWNYTAPVGSFPRDVAPCGAFDMGGNVSEWCTGGANEKPAVRGGNWWSTPEACRIATPRNPPAKDSEYVGLRVALDAPDSPR